MRPSRGTAALAAVLAAALALVLGWSAIAAAESIARPSVRASSAIVIDRVSGRVLYGKDIHSQRPMASCTKIMTALLVVERCRDLSRVVVVPAEAGGKSGIGLVPGERISIRQALLALVVNSANDAAVTLAYAAAGSESHFVALMNRRAAQLGLGDTHFENSAGNLRDGRHHSSVFDLAMLGRRAMRDARFRDLVGRRRAVVTWSPGHSVAVLSNNLLLARGWADGIKCGYTPLAGYCLVGSGKPGLRAFVTATLHAPDRRRDARDHEALALWASALYERVTVVAEGALVRRLVLADKSTLNLAARTSLTAVVRSAATVRRTFALPKLPATAPEPGTRLGSVTYWADGVKLGAVGLVVAAPEPSPSPTPTPSPTVSPSPTPAP